MIHSIYQLVILCAAILLPFWSSISGHAQNPFVREVKDVPEAPLLTNVYSRDSQSLAGIWKSLVQPTDSPFAAMIPMVAEPTSLSDHREFSFENGLTLNVPGDWNTQDDRLFFYEGTVWYKKEFTHKTPPGKRTFLYFSAVNYHAEVYLNKKLVCAHRGGFTPFNCDVTETLKEKNELYVRVNNELGKTDIPSVYTDWLNYGGITRDVKLVDVPKSFIQNYHIQLARDQKNRISGWVQLAGAEAAKTVTLAIPELMIKRTIETGDKGYGAFEVPAKPILWSPESPKLYAVSLTTVTDQIEDRIGFRTISVRGNQIVLNGEPVFLKGISIHEEAPNGEGRAYSPEHAETLLGWARELGCNYVRLAHYTHNEHMLRAADRLGLMVWAEIPLWGGETDFSDPVVFERAQKQMTEMITRDRNRASIILWGLSNETRITDERNAFFTKFNDFVHQCDPTRPTTAALLFLPHDLMQNEYAQALEGQSTPEEWTVEIRDPLGNIVDVAGINQYIGWYYSGFAGLMSNVPSKHARKTMLDNMHRIRFKTGLNKPILISETGGGAKAGLHFDENKLATFSEELQALIYRRQLEMLEKQKNICGLSPWLLKDFRSAMRLYQGMQDYWNLKGLVADDGRKKMAFKVLQDYYKKK